MIAILRKEMRSMLRERRSWLIPVIYAAVLAAIVYLFLAPLEKGGSRGSDLGTALAQVVAVVQTLAVLIFAPLVGASTIAAERERGTLTLLLASPGSRIGLGLGKLAAATLYAGYLLMASVPIAAVAFVFGGPDAAGLAGLYTTHIILAFSLVCIGMAVSTVFQRTWAATLASIGLALGLIAITTAIFIWQGGAEGVSASRQHIGILYFNPGFGIALFVGDGELGGRVDFFKHFAALLGLAAASLSLALWRLKKM